MAPAADLREVYQRLNANEQRLGAHEAACAERWKHQSESNQRHEKGLEAVSESVQAVAEAVNKMALSNEKAINAVTTRQEIADWKQRALYAALWAIGSATGTAPVWLPKILGGG